MNPARRHGAAGWRLGAVVALAILVLAGCSDREKGEVNGTVAAVLATLALFLALLGAAGVALRRCRAGGSGGSVPVVVWVVVGVATIVSRGSVVLLGPAVVLAYLLLGPRLPGTAAGDFHPAERLTEIAGAVVVGLGAGIVGVPLSRGLWSAVIGSLVPTAVLGLAARLASPTDPMRSALSVVSIVYLAVASLAVLAVLVGAVAGLFPSVFGDRVTDIAEYRRGFLLPAAVGVVVAVGAAWVVVRSIRRWSTTS